MIETARITVLNTWSSVCDKEELKNKCKEKAQELTIKNVTDGKSKYYCSGYYKGCLAGLEYNNKQIADLEKENAELKNFIMQSKKDGISPINALIIKNLGNQLTKAKEIIKKFSEFVNNGIEYDPEHPQEHTDLWNKLCEEAKQFLKDFEVNNALS
jgi:hypothetical protein